MAIFWPWRPGFGHYSQILPFFPLAQGGGFNWKLSHFLDFTSIPVLLLKHGWDKLWRFEAASCSPWPLLPPRRQQPQILSVFRCNLLHQAPVSAHLQIPGMVRIQVVGNLLYPSQQPLCTELLYHRLSFTPIAQPHSARPDFRYWQTIFMRL